MLLIMKACVNILVLLVQASSIFCQSAIEFLIDDKKIIYFHKNLTWNEGSSLCRSVDSSLVTINKFSFASHLAEALAAATGESSIWIGGRLIHNQWTWKLSGLSIQFEDGNTSLPILSNENLNLMNRKCLAINILNISYPTFLSFNCSEPKSVLCEKAQQQPTLLVEEFNYNNHNYTIYEGQSTWQTALAICNKHTMYLATLSDVTELQEVALTLSSYMHLDIDMVWVGALRDYKSFNWVTTGDFVEHTVHNKTEFSKCLTLDIKNQLFYADNCNNGHPFVCESKHVADDYWESFVYQATEYTVHSLKTTWKKAGQICEADNSYLATVDDLMVANEIAVNMVNGWEPLITAWLGAKAVQAKSELLYKWQYLNIRIPLKTNKNGYPPWKNATFKRDRNSCLVLERSASNVYFADSACDDVHGFICQRDSNVPLAITFNFKSGDKDLIFHDKPETWFKAQEVCELGSDRLLIVLDPDDLSSIKEFTTRHKLWLDGIYESKKWKWKQETSYSLTKEDIYRLPLVGDSSDATTKKCLAMQLQQKAPSNFVVSSCKEKMPFICERNSQKEQVVQYKGNEYTIINKHMTWHEASAICQARDQNLAVTCDINEAEFLSKLTTAYGDLWLGGIKRDKKWHWDAINVTLPHKTDKKIGYPPWLTNKARRKQASCLTLTLNSSSNTAFIDTSCWEIKSFVCEKYSIQSHKSKFLEPRVSVLDDRQYFFYPQLSTWKDANEECSDNLAFLAVVSTLEIARHIASLTYGYPEIWIGGYLEGDFWKWSINGENIKNWADNETQWASENEIFDENFTSKKQFLAINRLNPNIPLFMEKSGSERLGFVCERANNKKEEEYLLEKITFQSVQLLLVENKLNYTDASNFCEDNNGVLITANNPEIFETVAKYTKKFHGAWLGATLTAQSQKFLWTHIRSEVMEEIYSMTGELLNTKPRSKRSANNFMDEVLDKSETERETLNSGDGSDEDYASYSVEDADGDGIVESWEISTKSYFPNDDDVDFNTGHHNFKRAVKNPKAVSVTTKKFGDKSLEDEDITLPEPDSSVSNLKASVTQVTNSSVRNDEITTFIYSDPQVSQVSVEIAAHGTSSVPTTTEPSYFLASEVKISSQDNSKKKLTTATKQIYSHINEVTPPVTSIKSSVTTPVREATEFTNKQYTVELNHSNRNVSKLETELSSAATTENTTLANTLKTTQSFSQEITTLSSPEDTTTERITNVLLQNLIYCLKLDEHGKLKALNCSSRQSFVCEIRSNSTKVMVEKYSVGNITYAVSNERLSWNKAYNECNKTFGGYLAIFNNIDEINFLNNISKAFQDLWIGAKYVNSWKWPYINQNMQQNDSLWSTNNRLYNCTNIYRQHSSNLILVDRNCSERHGFICKDVKQRTTEIEIVGNYTIHWKPVNFFDALKTCTQQNTVLITGDTSEEVVNIINLQKGLHSFWVSALYLKDKWIWLHSNRAIKNSTIFNLGYTPGRECLNVFKKSNASYSLVDQDCSTYLPFVCANDNNRTLTFNGKSYTFYPKTLNWRQASEYCASKSQHMVITDEQSAGFIQNAALVFGDLWVGAKLENASKWVWDFTKEITYVDPITHGTIQKPPQMITDINSSFCLYAHSFLAHRGLLDYTFCFKRKAFVCQGVPASTISPVHSIIIQNRVYTMYSKLSTWSEAQKSCRSNGTYLTIIDTVEEIDALSKFELSFFWTGGNFQKTWIWDHTDKDIAVELLPHNNKTNAKNENCLSFYNDGPNSKFLYFDCSMQLPFVCEEMGHNNKHQTKRLDFDNEYLVLHNLPLTWDDANDMCESAGQHLASITSENVEHFLNLPSVYHDLWLDGKNEDDIWVWTELDLEVPTSYAVSLNNSNISLISFIRIEARSDYNCLSLYRQDVHLFSFLDSRCNDKLGFICQGTKYMPNHIVTIMVGGREYSIYSKKATWVQANKICKSNGTYLAVLNTAEEIELLTQKQVHFVKLWTGAINEQGTWIWDHTGAKIAYNNYTQHLSVDEQGCGIIKKSNQGGAAIVPKNCTASYAFVCEERGDQGKWTAKDLNIYGHYYSVYSERATWVRASDMCAESGQYLALIDTNGEMEIMNWLDIDFHDLWVGAKRTEEPNMWMWMHTGQEFGLDEIRNYSKLVNKTDSNCLNIYREWNSDSLFINRDCNEQHGYICESVPIPEEHPEVLRVTFSNHKYILIQKQLTWKLAYSVCERFNGYLAIIGDQAEADYLSRVSGAFHDLWIGGTNTNETTWKWYFTGQNIGSDVTWKRIRTRMDHNCLNLYSADGQTGIFMDRKCTEKHSFVCEETHQYDDIKQTDKLEDVVFPTNFFPYYADFKGKTYMFSNVRVDFNSAMNSCKAHSGYLLIFDDQSERDFIGNNTEGYHSLWIDGKNQNNTWIWEHIGTTIQSDNFVNYKGRSGHDCLLFYRHDNTTSYYVDRKCQEKHSFVCKDVNEEKENIETEFTYKNRFYLLIPNTRVTWYQAEEYCRRQSGYLAVVDNTEEAQFLASIGNDLWLNGKFENYMNMWTWYHTGQKIAFEQYDVIKYTPNVEAVDNRKCLNLYRSFNNSPRFVETDCNNKFGFVCEDLVALTSGIQNVTKEYNKRKYLFVNKRFSWQDAYDTCRKNGSYLAVISTQEEGNFIAQMANDFHDMWIDGKFLENSWMSVYTGQNLDTKQSVDTSEDNSSLNLITWASGEKRRGYNCFSAYLPSSDTLLFVDRNCSEGHSFVCEEVVGKSTPIKIIEYSGIRYTISSDAVSWEEAHRRCRKHGYLAIIDSLEEAAMLVKSSGEMHSFWIGAKYNKDEWHWNYTGELINQDYNLWVNVVPQNNSNCSILYRDNFLNPFIVDKSCKETFRYICEEGETSEYFEPRQDIKYDGKTYTFYRNPATWSEARNRCESNRATLAIVNSIGLATLLMAEREHYNFWIDGISEGLLWIWSSTGLYLQPIDRSVINYVRAVPRYPQSCLTLFRSNNAVRYLDEDCNITKSFLCQKYDSVLTGNITAIERNTTRYYLIDDIKKTWFEAWETCAANGSYLPIIMDEPTANFVASLFSYSKGDAWLGARKFSGWWTWELTDEPLIEGDTETEFPFWTRLNQPDNMCLGLGHQRNVYPVFADTNCSLTRLVICEQGCTALPAINGSWSRQQCTSRVQRIGEQCSISCNAGYLHTGVTNILCTSNGWSDYIPTCLNMPDFSLRLISNVKDALNEQRHKAAVKKRKNVGLLFLIDTSNNMKWEYYETVTEIIKSVSAAVRNQNDNILSGLVMFEAEASIKINFEELNTCSFIQKVDKLAYKSISDIVSYMKAFETAKYTMQNASVDGNSVLIIVTSSNSTEKLDEDLLHLKQTGNIIIVIGIKSHVNISLVQQLASPDSSKYHINIDHFALDELAYILNRTFLYSGKLACCMRLRNTNVFSITPTSCTRDVSPNNAKCLISCNGQRHLQGMESLLCTAEGWQSTLELQRPFPECYTTRQVAHKFIKKLKELYENRVVDSTLFMVDQSGSMIEEDFYNELKFVKHLLRMGNSKVGTIIFNSEAYITIPLKNYEDPDYICSLYDTLDSLSYSGGSTNYEKAFNTAAQEIESYVKNCSSCSNQNTLIVMITDGQNSETIEAAENLKLKGHIIVIISIAVNKRRSNLIKMVSNAADNSPLLFSINSFLDLEDIIVYIDDEVTLRDIVYCCKLPVEFQKQYLKMFIMQSENIEVVCPPGYSLSIDNNTLKCTDVGLNAVPTCFAVPKKISEFISAQFVHIFNQFSRNNEYKDEKQVVIFLIDQTETMTPTKNKQALAFIGSVASLLQLSENRTVGLINGQNHEAVILIEPNVSCPVKFSELLNNITFNSTSYSMYKPLKFILEKLVTVNRNVLTVIISERVYISTPSLKLAQKILATDSNIYVMEVHSEVTESNIAELVKERNDMFISGYYLLKDNLYSIDSFETLEAVAENIYLL